jgi:hypothetical protein
VSDWTSPADIASRVTSLWNRGEILAASLKGLSMFPFVVRMRKPDAKALAARFDDVREWIATLERGSKSARGFGYDIKWIDWNHRQLGRNRVPDEIHVETEDDAVRLIGKQRDVARFRQLVAVTLPQFPVLRDWFARAPLISLEHADEWDRIVAVLAWFRDHPRSGRYLRQLDVPGVDTKFIEDRRGVLSSLLDQILPGDAVERQFIGARNFEVRYGLLCKPALVRFRLLDPRLRLNGLSDISVPALDFSQFDPGVRRVFVTENETNGVAFPDVPESLVVFGLGYGVELLAGCEWFKTREVYYWGDIDTHGFAMLDRLRALFPHTQSLLMDRGTLLAHRTQWATEANRHEKTLERLTHLERALYDDLRYDRLGERLRLEQERIAFGSLKKALGEICADPASTVG